MGKSRPPVDSSTQKGPAMWSVDALSVVRVGKQLNKQSRYQGFDTRCYPCGDIVMRFPGVLGRGGTQLTKRWYRMKTIDRFDLLVRLVLFVSLFLTRWSTTELVSFDIIYHRAFVHALIRFSVVSVVSFAITDSEHVSNDETSFQIVDS